MLLSSSRRTLCLVALLTGFSGVAAAQAEVNQFFNDTVVQDIWLTVDPNDWATLLQNYTADTYYHATFDWNGVSQNIGIRQHGQGGRSPIKPSLDLNFAHYDKKQTFLGESFIVIKANNGDPSDLHEWISMKLFRKMGFPSPRESFGVVHVNGQVLGFYLLVEHEDLTFVQRNFGESGGYLYEWKNQGDDYELGNLGTNPSVYAPYLDLKSNQSLPDLQTFTNLIQAINQPSSATFTDANFIGQLSQYLDPKSFLTYAAIESALAESDGLVGGLEGLNNFYLYQFQGTTLYQLIPWDTQLTFSTNDRDILDGFTNGPNINVLAQRLIGIAGYENIYLDQLTKAATLVGGAGGWADQEITREYNLIDNAASNDDPNKQCGENGVMVTCGAQDFENGVAWIHTFLSLRSGFVISQATADGYLAPTNDPNIGSVAIAMPNGMPAMSPGALMAVTGTNLGPAASGAGNPLPRILGNTFVAVEGVRAPLLVTSSGQIELQVPWDVPLGIANVVVSVNGSMSNTAAVGMQATAPGIFAVTHADGSLIAPGSPVTAGETVVLYVTGLGATVTELDIGAAAPGDSLVSTIYMPQVSLGNVAMTVSFSGLTPGTVGLYQVNASAPSTLPQGSSVALLLSTGGEAASAMIALQ